MNNNRCTSWSVHARTDREACPPGTSASSATCIPETTVETKLSETGTTSLHVPIGEVTGVLIYFNIHTWGSGSVLEWGGVLCCRLWPDVSEKTKTHSKEIYNLYPSLDIVREFECRKTSKTCHCVQM